MSQNRRRFLQASGLAGAANLLPAAEALAAPPRPTPGAPQPMPRGLSFCTLRNAEGGPTLGIRTRRGVLDVKRAEAQYRTGAPVLIDDVIHGRGNLAALPVLAERAVADAGAGRLFVPEAQAAFGPCVTDPEKIICVGLNYRAHAAEAQQQVPEVPILFNKFNSALNYHRGTIAVSEENAKAFDYEAELVIVMGRVARNVPEDQALDYVLGYCCGHDFSARDLQMRTSQWMVGKAGDGWGPVGPWLVTADQVDPASLKIECVVNGEVRQSSNTSMLIHDCRKLVSYCSRYMTLRPGDIIFTGTPEGVIAGYPPEKRVWLKAGDRVVTRIEKLGELEFTLT